MPYPLSRPSFAAAMPAKPVRHSPARAAELVSRYPNLSRAQIDELAALMQRLNARDVALMIADEDLAPRLDAFWSAHRDLLTPSMADYAVIAAILSFPVVAWLVAVLVS